MTRVWRNRIGVIGIAALALTIWVAGCGFGGSKGSFSKGAPQHSVAQVLVLRGGTPTRGLEVLLMQNSPSFPLGPGQWGFPAGAAETDNGGADSARTSALVNLEKAGIRLTASELLLYAHWLIPGFDTIFYLARAPVGSVPIPDGSQTVDAGWFAPKRALAMHHDGKLPMGYLTVKQLESLVGFANADDALASARHRRVTAIHLRVIGEGDKARAVLPEDVPQG
jgi:hypothetical protein